MLRKELPARPRLRWYDIIKIEFNQIQCEAVEWIHLEDYRVQWRALVNTVTISGSHGGEYEDNCHLGCHQDRSDVGGSKHL
jgi:hypothetical protein